MAVAAFCGSFAGMSAQCGTSVVSASLLGLCTAAVFYLWDTYKVGVGKGGRLGTMAYLGNLAFDVRSLPKLLETAVMTTLSPVTAAGMLVSGTYLHFARKRAAKENTSKLLSVSILAAKVALFASVSHCFVSSSNRLAWEALGRSAAAIFGASWIVKESPGTVLPVALVGLAGSFTPLGAPVYLGAFLGMTRLPSFGWHNYVQASLLSALLLALGLADGFGGKLGFLSFLGVLFGM